MKTNIKIQIILLILFSHILLNIGFTSDTIVDLQRVFTTAKQRQTLDALRQNTVTENTNNATNNQESSTTVVNKIKVNGYITRSNGNHVVWVQNNHIEIDKNGKHKADLRQTAQGAYYVVYKIPGSERTIQLKPGQIYLINSAQVIESFQDNSTSLISTAEHTNSGSSDEKSNTE